MTIYLIMENSGYVKSYLCVDLDQYFSVLYVYAVLVVTVETSSLLETSLKPANKKKRSVVMVLSFHTKSLSRKQAQNPDRLLL